MLILILIILKNCIKISLKIRNKFTKINNNNSLTTMNKYWVKFLKIHKNNQIIILEIKLYRIILWKKIIILIIILK